MGFRPLLVATVALGVFASAASAQYTPQAVDKFIVGLEAERPELDRVGAALKEIDDKIAAFQKCYDEMETAARAAGKDLGGISGRVAVRAKCGASNADGMHKDRAKLIDVPEKVGAKAAGMSVDDYQHWKELITGFLLGDRGFEPAAVTVLTVKDTTLSRLLRVAIVKPDPNAGGGAVRTARGGAGGGMLGGMLGGAMGMMTMDMTWAYVGYLWGLMYMSGATMFEVPYQPGQFTRWEIVDSSQPDQKIVLERAMFRRDADKTEWWRIKTVMISNESADTINLESQFKPMDETGTTMQVVRMRGKLPGSTEAQEMIVPDYLTTLSPNGAFPMRPTKESLAGATVGTESISAGGTSYSARHIRFGGAGGSTEWWLSETAPGGVVKVQHTGTDADQKWTMNLVAAGNGAKSELGL